MLLFAKIFLILIMHDRGKNYYDNNDTLKIMVKLTMILCDKNYGGDSEDDCY